METQAQSFPQRKHLRRIPVWLPHERRVIYFVTVCCAEKRRLFIAPSAVRLAVECIQRIEQRHAWQVWNSCFMPDHVHLLLSPMQEREQSLSNCTQAWKSCVTLRLKRIGIAGSIWQGEFFDRLLRSDEKLEEKWKYIRENPVRAGLCAEPEECPFSGTPEEVLVRIERATV